MGTGDLNLRTAMIILASGLFSGQSSWLFCSRKWGSTPDMISTWAFPHEPSACLKDVTSGCLVPKCKSISNKGLIEWKPRFCAGREHSRAIKINVNFHQGHGPDRGPKAPLLELPFVGEGVLLPLGVCTQLSLSSRPLVTSKDKLVTCDPDSRPRVPRLWWWRCSELSPTNSLFMGTEDTF